MLAAFNSRNGSYVTTEVTEDEIYFHHYGADLDSKPLLLEAIH
jgi:hypothetical protein